MQQSISNPNQRFCYKCHYPANDSDARCPRCGGPLKTKSNIRMLGVALIFIGGFISAIMLGVMVLMLGIFAQTPASRLKGEEGAALLAVGIVGLVFAVGGAFALAGLWQLIFGRRNKWIVYISIGILVIVFVLGRIFMWIT